MEENGRLFPVYIMEDKELKINAKFIYYELLKATDNNGKFHGDIKCLGEMMGFTKRQTEFAMKELLEKGWVKKVNLDDFQKTMKEKGVSGMGKGTLVCEWCEIKTNVLDDHHFPVPLSAGGKDIVKICPNCHAEFHRLPHIYIGLK